MELDKEKMQDISAIYRYIYKYDENGEGIHRNTLKKHLLQDGKISSKERYNSAIASLLLLDKIKIQKENISLNPDFLSYGVLQKRNNYYLTVPNTNKRYPVDKRFAQGYKTGDILDFIIDYSGKDATATILGKSHKKLEVEIEDQTINPKTTIFANRPDSDDNKKLLGRVVKVSHDKLVFIPNKKSVPIRHIKILNDKEEIANFQDKICVMELDDASAPLYGGKIIEVKGDAGNPIHEFDAIAQNYGAIMNWNDPELKKEIEQLPNNVDTSNIKTIPEDQAILGRDGIVDLRHLPFVTIDPADCKDMDDAIYSTIDENGDFVCYTAVANVTKYVDLHSRIGENYINGGFTIYAPNKAYNILPTKLSTGICSLNPNEDRLAYVVRTVIDHKTGNAKQSNIFDSIIKSRQKYSYEQAQEITDNLQPTTPLEFLQSKIALGESLSADEQILMDSYTANSIFQGFKSRQMIRFNANNERDVTFNPDMTDIIDIAPSKHLDYHEVIEAFMIIANEASAKFTKDNHIDTIYRVHDKPNSTKANRSNEFFNVLGIDLKNNYSPQTMNNLINLIRGSENEEMINRFLIKMQSRAKYSDNLYRKENADLGTSEPISHYALQSHHYSHTTAPIRRIVDYVTQYNILAKLHGTKPIPAEEIKDIIELANKRQLDVDQAEKDFDDISSVIYAEKHIGEKFTGSITKFRQTLRSEEYEEEIVVIVKNDETGISAEIPLSQVIGALRAKNCRLSRQCCAIFDQNNRTVLTICKPLDFIVEKADRKAMTITGRTNKTLIQEAEDRVKKARKFFNGKHGYINTTKAHVNPVKMNEETKTVSESNPDEKTREY